MDDEHFKATIRVCTSTTFYSRVFGFNGKIKVEGPQYSDEEIRVKQLIVQGVANHSLFLEETDGWMECEHCGHAANKKGVK